MAGAYSPGLFIKERTEVEKIRRLPIKGEILVSKGERVKDDTAVARTRLPGSVYPLNAAAILNVEPAGVEALLLKKTGDSVDKGELLGRSRGFLGFFWTALHAPVTGTIETVSSATGQIIFREPPIPVEVNAYINGRVTEVLPDDGVKVRTLAAFVQGIFGIGREAQGGIKVKTPKPSDALDAHAVSPDDKGMILIAGVLESAQAYQAAADAGAAGVVAGGVSYGVLKKILGYEIGVAITGAEKLDLPLVITEGFGAIAMSGCTFDLISRHEGRRASLNGATQIRAGVIRPELIVPLDENETDGAAHPESSCAGTDLSVGTAVRIIRDPGFGTTGKVEELPPEPRRMGSETITRVVVIRADGGELFELPRANVEIIDG